MSNDEFVIYPIRLTRTTYNKLGDRSRTLEISRADLIRMVLREALKVEAPAVAPEVTQPAAEASTCVNRRPINAPSDSCARRYQLSMTWPSKNETRSTAEPGRDAIDRAGSITTTPKRSGDTAGECNRK